MSKRAMAKWTACVWRVSTRERNSIACKDAITNDKTSLFVKSNINIEETPQVTHISFGKKMQ